MTRAEVLAELREAIGDTVAPYAWSDTRLMSFLSLGQDQFCKDTGFFVDSSTYYVTTANGVATYAISDRVIEVKEVWYGSYQLTKLSSTPLGLAVGLPYGWRADQDTGKITLYPTPDAIYSLRLKTWRKAVAPLNRKTGRITLAGAAVAGNSVEVTINDTSFTYPVSGSTALSTVAQALAIMIDGTSGFSASAEGNVVAFAADAPATTDAAVATTGSITAVLDSPFAGALEIPADLHLAPVEWAAWRCLSDHDRELQDPIKAADHLSAYAGWVREGKREFRRLSGATCNVTPSSLYVV